MKTVVVDIDETLLKSRKICYYLRTLAKILIKLSFYFQKPNEKLIDRLNEYDNILVLTARGENYRSFTEKQLKRCGVKYNRLIMCNYSDLILAWKRQNVAAISPNEWIDDLKDKYTDIEGI
jgi:uncharacterized HAD superfamily protein